MFKNVTPDDDKSKDFRFDKEWKWLIKNAKFGVGIKIAGSARGHHLT